MDDARTVDRAERVGEVAGQVGEVGALQRSLVLDDLVERWTVDELGDEVGHGRRHVGVEHLGDVSPADPSEDPGLPGEARPGLGVPGDVRAKHLHRDNSTAYVGGAMDHAHAAFADPLPKHITAESGQLDGRGVLGQVPLHVNTVTGVREECRSQACHRPCRWPGWTGRRGGFWYSRPAGSCGRDHARTAAHTRTNTP